MVLDGGLAFKQFKPILTDLHTGTTDRAGSA